MARTRNILWHDPRPFPLARTIAKKVLKDKNFRVAKRHCISCDFDMLLVSKANNIWCVSCGLMVPVESVRTAKGNRRVKF